MTQIFTTFGLISGKIGKILKILGGRSPPLPPLLCRPCPAKEEYLFKMMQICIKKGMTETESKRKREKKKEKRYRDKMSGNIRCAAVTTDRQKVG